MVECSSTAGGSLFIKSGSAWRGVMPTIGRETGEMVPGEGGKGGGGGGLGKWSGSDRGGIRMLVDGDGPQRRATLAN